MTGRAPVVGVLLAVVAAIGLVPAPVQAAVTGTPAVAPDAVPGGFASWSELFGMQQRLNAAADAIQAAGGAGSGYANTIAAPENRQLVLYWKGAVPANVQAEIDRQRSNVPIVVRAARYSAQEVDVEVERIGRVGISSSPRVAGAAPRPDGSGIDLYLDGPTPGIRQAGQAQQARASVPDRVRSPVALFASYGGGRGIPFSRLNDSAPWFAGGRTYRSCTTGFAAVIAGVDRLLYAAHCDQGTVLDGAGQPIGQTGGNNPWRDTQYITASSAGKTFDGGVSSNVTKAVQGASMSRNGNWICTSGSWSGVRCNIKVLLPNSTWDGLYPLVWAEEKNRSQAAGEGDSGGPVFELPFPDTGKVIAKGIISEGHPATVTPCVIGETTRPDGLPRLCAWQFFYADVTQTLAYYGGTIKTG